MAWSVTVEVAARWLSRSEGITTQIRVMAASPARAVAGMGLDIAPNHFSHQRTAGAGAEASMEMAERMVRTYRSAARRCSWQAGHISKCSSMPWISFSGTLPRQYSSSLSSDAWSPRIYPVLMGPIRISGRSEKQLSTKFEEIPAAASCGGPILQNVPWRVISANGTAYR